MQRITDMTGQRFGSWVVLQFAGQSEGKAKIALWKCKCDCGFESVVYGTVLRNGKSTGCLSCAKKKVSIARTIHGHCGTVKSPTYLSWKSMKNRCYCETSPDYGTYGKLGVSVCDSWRDSFENFLADMGERPEGTTLDRIDFSGNYTKENCRWATSTQQSRNKKSSRFIEWEKRKITISEFAEIIGIDRRAARYRLVEKGMTPEEISLTVTKRGKISTIEGAV